MSTDEEVQIFKMNWFNNQPAKILDEGIHKLVPPPQNKVEGIDLQSSRKWKKRLEKEMEGNVSFAG